MDDTISRKHRQVARRQRILDAARRLFIDNGFHATGIAAIAKASDVAVAQIYRDFSSKEDIVVAIVEGDCRDLLRSDELDRALASNDAAAAKDWIIQLLLPRSSIDHDRLFIEIVSEVERNPRIAGIFNDMRLNLRTRIIAALDFISVDNEAFENETTADLVSVLSLGLIHHRLMEDGPVNDRVTTAIVELVSSRVARETG